jgi:CheY-like chemotaxis protein
MTAQNMGKKILSEAGYDVVAVSNGAAAVKKIAERKPDIIILDVYMPGYSGLEVCEKVRGSIDTLKIPVLLTVGKLEPYKAEDGHRVKADGVIIKPFEATDLLAIVKKFEERIALMPPPPIAAPPKPVPSYEEEEIHEPPVDHRPARASMQPMVEVPDHMAGSSAFTDMLGVDAPSTTQHHTVNTPAAAFETSVIVPAPPVISSEDEIPENWDEQQAPPIPVQQHVESAPEIMAIPVVAAPEPLIEPAIEATPEHDTQLIPVEASQPEPAQPSHPQFIPVFKEPAPQPEAEPEPELPSYEVMPTAAAPIGDIDIPREPALQETAEEATRSTVADHVEPGLMTPTEPIETLSAVEAEPTAHVAEIIPVVAEEPSAPVMAVAPPESQPVPPAIQTAKVEPAAEVSDSDFEARVAAAMAAYNHVDTPLSVAPQVIPAPATETAAANHPPAVQAFEVAQPAGEPVQSFEYHPAAQAAEPQPPSAPVQSHFVAEPVAIAPPEPVTAEPTAEIHDALTAEVETAAVNAAASEPDSDHHNIAQAVHRVMERLKPELVEEIMRELKSKK